MIIALLILIAILLVIIIKVLEDIRNDGRKKS